MARVRVSGVDGGGRVVEEGEEVGAGGEEVLGGGLDVGGGCGGGEGIEAGGGDGDEAEAGVEVVFVVGGDGGEDAGGVGEFAGVFECASLGVAPAGVLEAVGGEREGAGLEIGDFGVGLSGGGGGFAEIADLLEGEIEEGFGAGVLGGLFGEFDVVAGGGFGVFQEGVGDAGEEGGFEFVGGRGGGVVVDGGCGGGGFGELGLTFGRVAFLALGVYVGEGELLHGQERGGVGVVG